MASSMYQQLFIDSVSAVTATKPADYVTGQPRVEQWNGEYGEWKFMYNGGASDVGKNAPVTLYSGATGGFTCCGSTASQNDVVLGFVVAQTLSASCYGWVLTKGTVSFTADTQSAAVGSPLIAGTSGVVQVQSAVSVGSFLAYRTFGYAITTATTSGTGIARISCD